MNDNVRLDVRNVRRKRQEDFATKFLSENFYKAANSAGREVIYYVPVGGEPTPVLPNQVREILLNYGRLIGMQRDKLNLLQIDAAIPYRLGTIFHPGGDRIVQHDCATYINTWVAPPIKPSRFIQVTERPALWAEFLERWFIKADERDYFEQFVAFTVCRPSEHCDVAVLLRSEQGVGKNFFWDQVIVPFVGRQNAPTVSLGDLTGRFNGDMIETTAILVDEVYSDSKKSADRLKPLVTGRTQRKEEKYQPAKQVESFFNLFITSNTLKPLHIEEGDRRYWVPEFIRHRVDRAETIQFLNTFGDWLTDKGGLQELRDWLDIVPVEPAAFMSAPMTDAKQEIMAVDRQDDYRAELAQFVREKRGEYCFSIPRLQERWRYLSDHDIAAILKEESFVQKRLSEYGKARIWEHPEKPKSYVTRTIWSAHGRG